MTPLIVVVRRRALALGVTCIVAISATACSSSAPGLSSAEFTKQANAICVDVRTQLRAVAAPADITQAAVQYEKLLKISQAGVDQLAALKTSGADTDTRRALVDAFNAADAQLSVAVKAAAAKDDAAMNDAGTAYRTSIDAMHAIATKAGLDGCAAEGGGATADSVPDTSPVGTTAGTAVSAGTVQFVDATTLITPWDGQTFVSLTETEAGSLIDSLASDPNDPVKIVAAGALNVTDDTSRAQSLVLFFQLDQQLADADIKTFLGVIVGSATDATDTTIGTTSGVAFTAPEGLSSFATVHGDTAIIVLGQDAATVATTVTGLFAANPAL
ncbi:MAG: hypothetical protein F2789_05070 [Actinobacteria bacterium]|nr:hypothetical protein [Actinomycetota bacterium]